MEGNPARPKAPDQIAMDGRRTLQVSLVGTALLLFATALAIDSPVLSYQLSLVASTPPALWILLMGSFLSYAAGASLSTKTNRKLLLAMNLVGLAAVDALLIVLPALEYGTYYTQWDVWYQVTDAWRIWSTGTVSLVLNYYPGLHVLWASTAIVLNVPVFDMGIFLMAPIFAFKVPLLYLLARRTWGVGNAAALCAALAVVPDGVVGMFPSPWVFSVVLLLVLVYIMSLRARGKSIAVSALSAVVAMAMIVSHPLAPVFLFLSILLVPTVTAIVNRVRPSGIGRTPSEYNIMLAILPLALVLYLTWTGLLTVFLEFSIDKFVVLVEQGGILVPVNYGRFSSPLLQVRVYGSKVIGGVYFLGGWFLLFRNRALQGTKLGQLLIYLVLSSGALFLVFQNVSQGLGWGVVTPRMFTVAALFFPVLGGYFLWRVLIRTSRERLAALALVAALVGAPVAVEISAMYPSPYTSDFNYQNTQSLYSMVGWAGGSLSASHPVLANAHVGDYAYYLSQTIGGGYGHIAQYSNSIPSPLFNSGNSTVVYLILDAETVAEVSAHLRAWTSPTPGELALLNGDSEVARLFDDGGNIIYLGPLD